MGKNLSQIEKVRKKKNHGTHENEIPWIINDRYLLIAAVCLIPYPYQLV